MPTGRSTTKPTPLLSGTPYVIPSAAPNDMLTVMPTVMPTGKPTNTHFKCGRTFCLHFICMLLGYDLFNIAHVKISAIKPMIKH